MWCCDDLTSKKVSQYDEGGVKFIETLQNLFTEVKIDINIFNYIVKQKNTIIRQPEETVQILKYQIGIHKKPEEITKNNRAKKKTKIFESSQRSNLIISSNVSNETSTVGDKSRNLNVMNILI